MSMKIVNGNVEGFNLFQHRDNLKAYHCHWNPETKTWKAPDNTNKLEKYIEKVNDGEKKKVNLIWQKACKEKGYEFVKKGTPQYEEVLQIFKNHLKNSIEK